MITPENFLLHLAKLQALHQPLVGDYDYCQHHLDVDNPQFWRRALVRTITALAEAMASAMKRCALDNLPLAEPEKRQVLAGETYRLSKHGTVERHTVRTPAIENLLFAFRCYAELFGCECPLDTHSNEWAALITTFSIRHRVMHPRCAEDLEIKTDEVRVAQTAFCYIVNSMTRLHAGGCTNLASHEFEKKRALINQAATAG